MPVIPAQINRPSNRDYPNTRPRRRVVAEDIDWTLCEVVCAAGPQDRPFEEQHEHVSIGFVTAGTFQYRTDAGTSVLYPGAFLLGNSGACFECGHEHGTGDRCMALYIKRHAFDEMVTGITGSSRFRFRRPMVPARVDLITLALALHRTDSLHEKIATEGAVFRLVDAIVLSQSQSRHTPGRLRARDVRQLTGALRFIDARSADPISLVELAAIAAMSKYHFLRTFKRVTGVTPYQYVLQRRLYRVASELAVSRESVVSIAMREGFADLSTFNRQFRRNIGMTPTQFRSSAMSHAPARSVQNAQ